MCNVCWMSFPRDNEPRIVWRISDIVEDFEWVFDMSKDELNLVNKILSKYSHYGSTKDEMGQ